MLRQEIRKDVVEKVNEIQRRNNRPIRILDIGGGHFPFALATHIVDIISYEDFQRLLKERKYSEFGYWGADELNFSKNTWYSVDICKEKLPFEDKYFDFCVCCSTLEDLPNPFKVIEEISRVSKAGYIEVPSKEIECTLGVEGGVLTRFYTGYYHHLWLFTKKKEGLYIEPKYSFIAASKCFCFKRKYVKIWKKNKMDIVSYFWENKINLLTPEVSVFGDLKEEQMKYIREKSGYNLPMLLFDLYRKFKKVICK